MKLIIGLGNPGAEYDKTRHNFGFAAVEFFAGKFGATWNFAKKFDAAIAEIDAGASAPDSFREPPQLSRDSRHKPANNNVIIREKILLAKPQTFYNLSGECAQKIAKFYKISTENILVIHDELDLPLGVLRARQGGRDAGNNGVKNLIANLGGDGFSRIRIGSGIVREKPENSQNLELRDGKARPDSDFRDYVLAKISRDEAEIFADELPIISQIILDFANGEFRETTYKI